MQNTVELGKEMAVIDLKDGYTILRPIGLFKSRNYHCPKKHISIVEVKTRSSLGLVCHRFFGT
jgi:hypothetical protein